MEEGIGFDGSLVGLKSVKSGDMVLVPDLGTAFLDPFWENPTLSFICRTLEADTHEIFANDPRNVAIRRNATAVIVVHNHPSGDPTPSPDDMAVTRALVQVGKLLGVNVSDHLIVGQGRFVSLKESDLHKHKTDMVMTMSVLLFRPAFQVSH